MRIFEIWEVIQFQCRLLTLARKYPSLASLFKEYYRQWANPRFPLRSLSYRELFTRLREFAPMEYKLWAVIEFEGHDIPPTTMKNCYWWVLSEAVTPPNSPESLSHKEKRHHLTRLWDHFCCIRA